jgi:hypothetical protein
MTISISNVQRRRMRAEKVKMELKAFDKARSIGLTPTALFDVFFVVFSPPKPNTKREKTNLFTHGSPRVSPVYKRGPPLIVAILANNYLLPISFPAQPPVPPAHRWRRTTSSAARCEAGRVRGERGRRGACCAETRSEPKPRLAAAAVQIGKLQSSAIGEPFRGNPTGDHGRGGGTGAAGESEEVRGVRGPASEARPRQRHQAARQGV